MLIVQSRKQNKSDSIQLRISINGKQTFLQIVPIIDLKLKVNEKQICKDQNGCQFKGLKKTFQFGDLYLGPDSSIQFDMNSKLQYQNCMIRSDGGVYLNKIQCVKLTIKGQSVVFYGENLCDESIQFMFSQSSVQAQIYKNNGISDSYNGSLNIVKNGKIECKRLKVSVGTFIGIGQNSILKINTNKGGLIAEHSKIHIQLQGKLYSLNRLQIISASIVNQGYISTKNQENGAVFITTQKFDNFGQLKFPNLVILAKQMKNFKQAEIEVKNGKIVIEKSFLNLGSITIPSIQIGFVNQHSSQGKVQNIGMIGTKKFLIQAQYCFNSGLIYSHEIIVSGKNQKNLFKNTNIISSLNLQILNMIFINTSSASIISHGQMQIFIEGWINCGQIQNKENTYVSVKGHIQNAGSFQLNEGYLRANTIKNQNSINAKKTLVLDVQQIFKNDKKGSLNMPNLTIWANKIRNLGSIQVQNLNIEAKILSNEKQGKIKAKTANISAKYINNQGETLLMEGNISTKKMNNDGDMFVNKINYFGDQIKNSKNFQANSGQINTKMNYSDTSDAKGVFRNISLRSKNDDIFYTQGTLKMENIDFNHTFKHFYNKKQVDFDRIQLMVGGLHVNNLNMKDTHITFTTLKQENDGKIVSKGGYNGLHEGERLQYTQQKQNQFKIDIKSSSFYQNISIICEQQNQIVIGTTNPYINGWNLLSHPIAVGQFTKRIVCQNFTIPGNLYQNNLKKKVYKKVTGISPQLFQKYYGQQIPNTGQLQLIIQTQNLLFGGKLKYSGKSLNINSRQVDLVIGSIQVSDGLIKINAQQNIFLTHSYIKAKGIQLKAINQISLQASKMLATCSDLLMKASKIKVLPTVQKKHTQTTSRNGKVTWVHDWQVATRCQIKAEGNIIVRAEQYITMIAPHIQAKKNLVISSPNTYIQGIYLLDETTTYVKKKKTFGGSKTNVYGQRGDKPLQAILQGQQLIFDGNAKINATFKGKKLIDFTDNGIKLFYVIGYSGSYENRQFSNFCTQGFQGYSHTRQKFLKANVSQLQQIVRDYNLPGQMIFDTVEWGKIRPIVIGNYEQLIHYPKQWYTSWCQQSIGAPLAMVISMVIAYLGANVLGPALVSIAGVAKASIAAMAIKTSTSLICSRFLTPLVLTGRLDAALKSLFSIDTVIAAATNIGLDSLVNVLAAPLGINLISHGFLDVLKKNFIQFAFNTGVQALQGQEIGKAFTNGFKGLISNVLAQVGGNFISNYSLSSGTDYFIHKALHAGLGAVTGLISGGNIQSIFSGAVAGVITEIVIEALVQKKDIVKAHKTSDNPSQQFQLQKLIAKIAGGVAGGLCGNFQVAMEVACNAINYNFTAALENRLKKITKNDKQYLQDLDKQHQEQIKKMVQDDAREVALADLSYAADESINPLFEQKQQNTPQFLQKKKKEYQNFLLYQKQKYPDVDIEKLKKMIPMQIKKTITAEQLYQAQHKAFQNFKQKHPYLKFDNFKLVFNKNAGIQTNMDYLVFKSDQEKKIYIGVAGTRFFGVNHNYDFDNDKNINFKGYAIPMRQQNAQNFVRGYAKFNPDYKIIISGHSLGGFLCENIAVKLTKQYKNIWATSVNAYNGWASFANKKSNNQIINNNKIKRIRINNQWLMRRHGITNFHPIYDAAKQIKNKH